MAQHVRFPTKEIVFSAVQRGTNLINTWPESFLSNREAETYITNILDKATFSYGYPAATPMYVVYGIKNRTSHLIAMRAYSSGKFKLLVEPPGREVLWRAVEDAIAKCQAVITTLPPSFPSISEAQSYIHKIARENGVRYEWVGNIHPLKVGSYAHWHTACRAYAKGKFTLQHPPDTTYVQRDAKGQPIRPETTTAPNNVTGSNIPPVALSPQVSTSPFHANRMMEEIRRNQANRARTTEKFVWNLTLSPTPSPVSEQSTSSSLLLSGSTPSVDAQNRVQLTGNEFPEPGILIDVGSPEVKPTTRDDVVSTVKLLCEVDFFGEHLDENEEEFARIQNRAFAFVNAIGNKEFILLDMLV